MEDASRSWEPEEELVLDALRRSATRLNDASEQELADYISGLAPEQLRGVVSNVKGIYHELLFVQAENIDADEVTARVFEATNHPGADVEFIVDGEVIRAVQLKAVASPDAVFEHLARYPEIEIVATEEVAAAIPMIDSSGLSNADISADVARVVSDLPGDGLATEMAEGAATSALLAGAMSAAQVLRSGKVSRQQFATAFGDISVGMVTATALDVLIEGLS
ncbi:hypothetical protein [Sedimentimonas flavescens]|uniref:hypothetical protein n=1 Tax=Sedimentimonas flavescens TaxID=2851012 RepID=UPI001C49DAD6|nr:hypothetical protein [Sedimentimonas flavescens]